jgi:hypothetical protein
MSAIRQFEAERSRKFDAEISGPHQITNLGVRSSNLFGRASPQPCPFAVDVGVARVEARERQHRYVRLPDPRRLKFGLGTFRAAAPANFARARWCGPTVRANSDPPMSILEHDQKNRLLAQQALHWPQEGLECLLFLSLRPDIKRWGDVGRR